MTAADWFRDNARKLKDQAAQDADRVLAGHSVKQDVS